jgi:hypothetical protein
MILHQQDPSFGQAKIGMTLIYTVLVTYDFIFKNDENVP